LNRITLWLAAFSGALLLLLLATCSWNPVGRSGHFSAEPPKSTADQGRSGVPELVANQLKTGDLSCLNADPVTYEACLLYQGALGAWQAVRLPDVCPDVRKEPAPLPQAAKLTPEDVLRAPKVPCFSYLYAIQVANAVPVLISTATRAFRMLDGAFAEPGSNPKLCIEARHGICGNQAAVGLALFEKAGLLARPVEFYYHSNGQRISHIIVEVLIDGDWHPIDTTYGAYWIDSAPGAPFVLRTLEQVLDRTDSRTKLVLNGALFPYRFYKEIAQPDFFDYLAPGADLLRGGAGIIKLSLHGDSGVETFGDIPNYLGDNIEDGNRGGVSYRLEDLRPGTFRLTVNVAGIGEDRDQPIYLCVDNTCRNFSKKQQQYEFELVSPKVLYLKSESDVAYLILKSVEWKLEN
jgi:hypothetical protein